jgi:type I restriction enzyme, S subunit
MTATEHNDTTTRRWPTYPAYKDSGVDWLGEIPSDWEVRRLRDFADVRPSNVDKKSQDNEPSVHLCNYVDVYYNDYITSDLEFMRATATSGQITNFELKKGDVIITKDSESWDDIAVPAYVPQDLDGILCGYHLTLIRVDATQADGEYIFRAFASPSGAYQFQVAANGITRYGLPQKAIKDAVFLLPSLPEQRAIADFLDRKTAHIDTLIAKKQRLIDLLQEKRSALISHAVTKGLDPDAPMKDSGIEWLGEIPRHWEVKKLKYLVQMLGGGTPSKNVPEYWNGNIPWVSPKDMKTEWIDATEDTITELGLSESTTTLISEYSILAVVRSGILKHSFPVAINTVPVALNQDMKALEPVRTLDVAYLAWLLRGKAQEILALCHHLGATVDSIRAEFFVNMMFGIPPLKEQQNIVSFVGNETKQIDTLIAKTETTIQRLQEYRTALISAAVTGKIDVRGESD